MQLRTTVIRTHPKHPLARQLDRALNDALTADRNSDDRSFLRMDGMSGWRYRLLINKLIGLLGNTSYLEVGCWKGSTFCSAIHGNKVRAVGIDNWAEFGGPKDDFLRNVEAHKTPDVRSMFIEMDFRKVDFSALGGPFDVYLFDGPHGEADQRDGIALALPALADTFILIVDDWNFGPVPLGTKRALREAGLRVLHAIEINTTIDGSYPPVDREQSEWHNGYFIGVLSKAA